MASKKYKEELNRRFEARGVDTRGAFIEIVLPILLQLLPQLPCFKPKPTPTPQPASSQASKASWKKADDAKSTALNLVKDVSHATDEVVEYKKLAINKQVKRVMKQKRKDGSPITKEDAENGVLASLDQARLGSLEENACKIDELPEPKDE